MAKEKVIYEYIDDYRKLLSLTAGTKSNEHCFETLLLSNVEKKWQGKVIHRQRRPPWQEKKQTNASRSLLYLVVRRRNNKYWIDSRCTQQVGRQEEQQTTAGRSSLYLVGRRRASKQLWVDPRCTQQLIGGATNSGGPILALLSS